MWTIAHCTNAKTLRSTFALTLGLDFFSSCLSVMTKNILANSVKITEKKQDFEFMS